MTAMILDERMTDRLIAERQRLGLDRYDEVWDGVYVMSPPPNILHQKLVDRLREVLNACRPSRADTVVSGVGVSPLAAGWEHNYRVPDVSVVLTGNPIIDHGTHYQGGPDLVVEVRSGGGDRVQDKFDLYAELGVREVLVVERDTREPALFRLGRKKLARVRPTDVDGQPWLVSQVLPLAFARAEGKGGPRLLTRRTSGAARTWRV
jgi:Uma2 family endonuclease